MTRRIKNERSSLAQDRGPWLFMIAGSLLRLVWPLDMEWKFDEKWMYDRALSIATGQKHWTWMGMPSGVGLQNPGLSVWNFALIAKLTHDPVAMAQVVQCINILVLWGFALWVLRTWSVEDRSYALWGVALFAVSPLAVLFSRKLWAQDVLLLYVLPWLWGHRKRQQGWGAATWGLFGALLGQVHMSGFFAAAALLVVTVFQRGRRFPVWPWLLGSTLGALPLVPWLKHVLAPGARAVESARHFSFGFLSDAAGHAFGLGLEYPLGGDFLRYLRGPELFGIETYLNGGAQLTLLALLGYAIFARVRALGAGGTTPEPIRIYLACVLLTGVMLFVLRVEMFAHYLIVFGPLLHIAAIWLLPQRRTAWIALCSLQAFLSLTFSVFIHQQGGAALDDYGKTYRTQNQEERRLDLENKR